VGEVFTRETERRGLTLRRGGKRVGVQGPGPGRRRRGGGRFSLRPGGRGRDVRDADGLSARWEKVVVGLKSSGWGRRRVFGFKKKEAVGGGGGRRGEKGKGVVQSSGGNGRAKQSCSGLLKGEEGKRRGSVSRKLAVSACSDNLQRKYAKGAWSAVGLT